MKDIELVQLNLGKHLNQLNERLEKKVKKRYPRLDLEFNKLQ